jgi:lysophospholipase L1-like esterase
MGVAGCATAKSGASADKWEQDIRTFEAADRNQPPPPGATLFVGSSSIRLWETLKDDFADRSIVQRGFGGSQMTDLVAFTDRIVIPYRPAVILVYEGDNDLAQGRSPKQILAGFELFCAKVHAIVPGTHIAFIAIKPSIARRRLMKRAANTNTQIAQFCETDARLSFIDTYHPMLDAEGEPRSELFDADNLHLNRQGYALWTEVIRRHLDRIEADGAESRPASEPEPW